MEADAAADRPSALAQTVEVGDLAWRGRASPRAASGSRPRSALTLSADESRALQEHVALFGLVGAGLATLALCVYLVANVVQPGIDDGTTRIPHLTGIGISLAAWLICRGAPRSPLTVRIVEAASMLGVVVAFAVMTISVPRYARPDLICALITLIVTLARTILVPSSALRTFLLTTASWLPTYGVAYLLWTRHQIFFDDGSTRPFLFEAFVGMTVWATLGTVLVTVTSQVIYGLRREVREAKKLGQYTLLEKLGEGGMGQVFRAQHAMLRRPTAVKLLHPDRAGDDSASLARFEREVQLTAQLSHPNVVTVFDFGRTPTGVFYYAMELLDGQDLETLVEREGPMSAERTIRVLRQVASALAEAHAVGLIHRDIKPANIILTSRAKAVDVAKVVDFGLVKDLGDVREELTHSQELVLDASPSLSKTGAILGTPMYLAPEALTDPTAVDGRADLYALGAVGYYLLSGTTVFSGSSIVEVCRHHLHSVPTSPSKRLGKTHPGATIPAALEAIIMRCLEKRPQDRFRNAAEVEAALDDAARA